MQKLVNSIRSRLAESRPWYLSALLLISPIATSAEEDDAMPSLEFLEYLGEWQDDTGAMIDPFLLSDQGVLADADRTDGDSQ